MFFESKGIRSADRLAALGEQVDVKLLSEPKRAILEELFSNQLWGDSEFA